MASVGLESAQAARRWPAAAGSSRGSRGRGRRRAPRGGPAASVSATWTSRQIAPVVRGARSARRARRRRRRCPSGRRQDARRHEVDAHRDPAALAGEAERLRLLGDAGDGDGRVRLLERLEVDVLADARVVRRAR